MIGLCLVAVFAMSAVAAASASAGNYIVVLKDSVGDPGAVAQQQAKDDGARVSHVYSHALKGYAAAIPANKLAAVRADPRVNWVGPDTTFVAAGGCSSEEQCVPFWALRVQADQSTTRSGDGEGAVDVNVAVLDTGIDTTHPDLNVVGGVNCSNGHSFQDVFGHGTIVSGILAAKDNGFGVVGIAPGARLWAVRVLNNKDVGSTSSILCGIDWVTATRSDADPSNDIAVANMSLIGSSNHVGDDGNCGYTRKDPEHQAICASVATGVTYVVAAGNASVDFQHSVPAAYHEVLTATAIADYDAQPGGLGKPPSENCSFGADDSPAVFSNFATLAVDQAHILAAPGVCIGSTTIGGTYGGGSGTSFASPIVAGTVALCLASGSKPCAGLTPAQIVTKIVADAGAYNGANPGYGFTGDPLRPVEGKYYGYLIHAGSY
jgi:subtilisin family serine protease